jgi:N-acetyl-gamma-glutamyl-phosphate reductase
MIKVGIAGATGYVGIELLRLLSKHPQTELAYIGTQSYPGKSLQRVYPHLQSIVDIDCSPIDAIEMAEKCDVVFTALPHGLAVALVEPILEAGKRVIDLGSDFRLKTPALYEKWYGQSSASSALLASAIYGLPEIVSRQSIKGSNLIANPGCYPTCIALGANPAISHGIVKTQGMIFDAKSGVSGAGRGLSLNGHFCEVAENFKAYAIGGSHRHTPEIEQILGELAGDTVTVQFTPHLLPIVRGLLATGYFQLQEELSPEAIWEIYAETYEDEPFVRLSPLGVLPQTANVRGSNYCDIGLAVDRRTNTLITVSVIDNLVKGAAGQALQNMNILFELPETMGLTQLCPAYP